MPEITKQPPAIAASNRSFWEAVKKHELVICRCHDCGAFYSQAVVCAACGGSRMEWVKASGRGKVFTFCVFRQAFHPAWRDDIPYNVAYVKLDEGPLLISNIVGCSNDDICIGMPVEVTFEEVSDGVTLPRFTPVR